MAVTVEEFLRYRVATYYENSYPSDVLEGGGEGGGGDGGDPVINTLVPVNIAEDAGDININVVGSGFDADAEVEVDGTAIPTTRTSSTQVRGAYTVTGAAGTTYTVTVRNVGSGLESNDFVCNVTAATPNTPNVMAAVPNPVTTAGAQDVAVNGTGFDADAVVAVDGVDVPTTFVDESHLTANITPPVGSAVNIMLVVRNVGAGTADPNPYPLSCNVPAARSGTRKKNGNGG